MINIPAIIYKHNIVMDRMDWYKGNVFMEMFCTSRERNSTMSRKLIKI